LELQQVWVVLQMELKLLQRELVLWIVVVVHLLVVPLRTDLNWKQLAVVLRMVTKVVEKWLQVAVLCLLVVPAQKEQRLQMGLHRRSLPLVLRMDLMRLGPLVQAVLVSSLELH